MISSSFLTAHRWHHHQQTSYREWIELHGTALRYEYRFWEAAYHGEDWV